MDSVSADDDVCTLARLVAVPAHKCRSSATPVLTDFDATLVKVEQPLRKRLLEEREQLGTVSNIAMRGIQALACFPHLLNRKHPAIFPAAKLPRSLELD